MTDETTTGEGTMHEQQHIEDLSLWLGDDALAGRIGAMRERLRAFSRSERAAGKREGIREAAELAEQSCTPKCDSYAHDPLCPWVHTSDAIRALAGQPEAGSQPIERDTYSPPEDEAGEPSVELRSGDMDPEGIARWRHPPENGEADVFEAFSRAWHHGDTRTGSYGELAALAREWFGPLVTAAEAARNALTMDNDRAPVALGMILAGLSALRARAGGGA